MKSTYVLYDPAIWNSRDKDELDSDLPWSDYVRRRGIPLYSLKELTELDAKGALDRMSDADRETLFREARSASERAGKVELP
jgi:hypothetical protein